MAPLSIRLNATEWADLRALAGNAPLSSFVKSVLFANARSQRKRVAVSSLPDQKQIAALLAQLGRSSLATNVRILAHQASVGVLNCDEGTTARLVSACTQINEVRDGLMKALGKEPRSEVAREKHITQLFELASAPRGTHQ